MAPFMIDSNSWHFRLIANVKGRVCEDICGYTRQLLTSLLALMLLATLSAIMIASCGSLLMWIWICLEYKTWLELEWHSMPIILLFTSAIIFIIIIFIIITPSVWPAPGFAKTVYRAFHDKFCVPLEFW